MSYTIYCTVWRIFWVRNKDEGISFWHENSRFHEASIFTVIHQRNIAKNGSKIWKYLRNCVSRLRTRAFEQKGIFFARRTHSESDHFVCTIDDLFVPEGKQTVTIYFIFFLRNFLSQTVHDSASNNDDEQFLSELRKKVVNEARRHKSFRNNHSLSRNNNRMPMIFIHVRIRTDLIEWRNGVKILIQCFF